MGNVIRKNTIRYEILEEISTEMRSHTELVASIRRSKADSEINADSGTHI